MVNFTLLSLPQLAWNGYGSCPLWPRPSGAPSPPIANIDFASMTIRGLVLCHPSNSPSPLSTLSTTLPPNPNRSARLSFLLALGFTRRAYAAAQYLAPCAGYGLSLQGFGCGLGLSFLFFSGFDFWTLCILGRCKKRF